MFYDNVEDRTATYSESIKEYASNAGMDNPDTAWILTPYDTWERNPSYRGEPVPHPEDWCDDDVTVG